MLKVIHTAERSCLTTMNDLSDRSMLKQDSSHLI